MTVSELITALKASNITLKVQDGQLQVKAPVGTMTPVIRAALKQHKEAVLRLLGAVSHSQLPPLVPIGDSEWYEVSHAQKRLWLIDHHDTAKTSYNIPGVFSVEGQLDTALFEKAVNQLVQRHEILRTSFITIDGLPKQKVHQQVVAPIEKVDLSDSENQDEALGHLMSNEFDTPFDLANGPLWKLILVLLANDKYVFVLNLHHIISDAWSMNVIFNEVLTNYSALVRGKESPLRPLEIQYKDYAAWQLKLLREGHLKEAEDYWVDRFKGKSLQPDLPTDFPRANAGDFTGKSMFFEFEASQVQAIEDFAKMQQVSVFSLLLAAVKALLFRYTGEEDITVGTTTTGRANYELEGQIGFYINTLPLYTRVDKNDSFKQLLEKVNDTTLDAFKHELYPFDKLIEALALDTDSHRSPLFDVLVELVDIGEGESQNEAHGLSIQEVGGESNVSKFDLSFRFIRRKTKLYFILEYKTALYSEEKASSLSRHLVQMMTEALTHSESTLANINYLTSGQLAEIEQLSHGNRSTVANKTVVELFEQQVENEPEAIAIIFGENQLTYQQLNDMANSLSGYLRNEHRITKGDTVALLMEHSDLLLVGFLGILRAGAIALPLATDQPKARTDYYLSDASTKLVITHSDFLMELMEGFNGGLVALDVEIDIIKKGNYSEPEKVSIGDSAYIIYTSGSTGKPKGVKVGNDSFSNYIQWANNYYFGQQKGYNFPLFTSISFDLTLTSIFSTLTRGDAIYISREKELGIQLTEIFGNADSGIKAVKMTPSHVSLLGQLNIPTSSISHVILGGEEVKQTHCDILKGINPEVKIFNEYGPTEATIGCTVKLMESDQNMQSIGGPIDNTSIYILDDTMNYLPVGVDGEIYIGGKCLAKGYFNNEALTNERFVINPFSEGQRLYKTGDYGRWSSNGEILFKGRKDHQVKIRGNRIELEEIRSVLLKNDDIIDAIVLAIKDKNDEKQLVVYYLSHTELDTTSLVNDLEGQFPRYMVPSYYRHIVEIPVNENGKLDTKSLPGPFDITTSQTAEWIPANEREINLQQIWQEVLRVDKIHEQDDFFQHGGDSLKATQMVVRIRQEIGVAVELQNIFDHSSIEKLTGFLGTLPAQVRQTIPVLSTQEYYEVSFAQRRLWILHTLGDQQTPYNLPGACIFNGPFDKDLFDKTLQLIIQRHEILRTIFIAVDGEPKQVVHEYIDFELEYLTIPEGEHQKAELDALLDQLSYTRFDLEAGPAFRAKLIVLGPDRCCLLFVVHHIISDGWSMEVLVNEVATIYKALRKGDIPQLKPLRIQYKDYASWQKDELEKQSREAGNYWLETFQKPIPVLHLPTDFPRPPVKTFDGKLLRKKLSPELSRQVNVMSNAANNTLFMTLLASIYALLYRYTGQRDMVIGTPIAGRDHFDLEGQLGCFVNTLALRSSFDTGISFSELLAVVRKNVLGAFQYQLYPFDRLVDDLELERDLSHSTLFDVMVQLQNEKGIINSEEEGDLFSMENYAVDFKYTKFDLSFNFTETLEGLTVDVEYNTDLFKPSTISRMMDHYENLLQVVSLDQSLSLNAIPYISEREKIEVLNDFNQTTTDYPFTKTLHQLIEEQAKRFPNKEVVIFQDNILTYEKLNDSANQLANYLVGKYNVGQGGLIAVLMDRSEKMMIALLAVLKSGAAYVPIDPDYPRSRIQYIIKDTGAKALLLDSYATLGGKDLKFSNIFCFDQDWQKVSQCSSANLDKNSGPNSLAYVIYTSGSTGEPKGAMLEHNGVVNRIDWMWRYYSFNTEDVIFQKTPYVFDVSVWEIFMTLCYGAKMVMCQKEAIYDPQELVGLISKHQITTVHFVPTMLKVWVDAIGPKQVEKLNSLKRVVASGEALHPEMVHAFYHKLNVPLHNLYGPTEASVDVSAYETKVGDKIIPIGKPISNIKLYVLDDQLQLLPVGVEGGLFIAGVGVARGYLNKPELTENRFIDNPYSEPGYEKLYRTGDRAKWLPDGNIQLAGREDDQVKIRGFRIELGEITNALLSHDHINEALVMVHEQEKGGKQLVAYYIPDGEAEIDFQQFLSSLVPGYMIPSNFIPLETFPVTPNGKLDKKLLPKPTEYQGEQIPETYENEMQETLAEAWKMVLGRQSIGINDNFFSIGGDSIKSIQVVAKLHELKYKISTHDIFQYPTIRGLSQVVSKKEGFADQSVVTGRVPLSPVQHQFFKRGKRFPHHYNQALMVASEQRMDKKMIKTIFGKLMEHHDALRMSFKERNGRIVQYNHVLSYPFHLAEHDLREDAHPENKLASLAEGIQASIDIATGPLVKLGLFHLADGDRLLIVIHHLIMDVVSWYILLEDLEALYSQYNENTELVLPPKDHSFKAWSQKMNQYAKSGLSSEEKNYWTTVAAEANQKILLDFEQGENLNRFQGKRQFTLSREETADLTTKVGKAFNTEINDILLAALALAVHKTFELPKVAIALESHGREELFSDININRTIGWFTNIYPVVLDLAKKEDLSRFIKDIKEQIRKIPNKGIGYGLVKYLMNDQYGSLNIDPQISFNYLGQVDATVHNWSFDIAPEPPGSTQSPDDERDYLLEVTGAITEGQLGMAILYSSAQFEKHTVQTLIQNYHNALNDIIALCVDKKHTEKTPSDLGYKDISMEELENFFN